MGKYPNDQLRFFALSLNNGLFLVHFASLIHSKAGNIRGGLWWAWFLVTIFLCAGFFKRAEVRDFAGLVVLVFRVLWPTHASLGLGERVFVLMGKYPNDQLRFFTFSLNNGLFLVHFASLIHSKAGNIRGGLWWAWFLVTIFLCAGFFKRAEARDFAGLVVLVFLVLWHTHYL